MHSLRRQIGVVDDPAYGGMLAGPACSRKGVWGAILMSVGTALVVAAVLVYAPTATGSQGRPPVILERLAD